MDMLDGPSSLQKREGLPTLKEKGGRNSPTVFESERENHLNTKEHNLKTLREVKDKLAGVNSQTSMLKSPSA